MNQNGGDVITWDKILEIEKVLKENHVPAPYILRLPDWVNSEKFQRKMRNFNRYTRRYERRKDA